MNYLFFKDNRLHAHVDIDDFRHIEFDVARYFATKGLGADEFISVIEKMNHIKELGRNPYTVWNYNDYMRVSGSYAVANRVATLIEVYIFNSRPDENKGISACIYPDYHSTKMKRDWYYCNTPYNMKKDAEDMYNKAVERRIYNGMMRHLL